MRVTVCELPGEPGALEGAWAGLCAHASRERSELVLLPEIPFSGPLWLTDAFEPGAWRDAEAAHDRWLSRLGELGAPWVVGTRPVTDEGRHFNEGFLWSAGAGPARLRRKYFLPDEPGGFEARWFARGDSAFPCYAAGDLSFGLNVCTELWALETFRTYAASGVHAILAPRASAAATTEKWLSLGAVAAVAAGAYCLSSNRVHRDGSCGGVGFAVDPDGGLLARTSEARPCCTVEVEPERVREAAGTYPRYVFSGR